MIHIKEYTTCQVTNLLVLLDLNDFYEVYVIITIVSFSKFSMFVRMHTASAKINVLKNIHILILVTYFQY